MSSVIEYLESHIPTDYLSTYREWLIVRQQGRSLIGLLRDRHGVKSLKGNLPLLVALESAWDIRDYLLNL